MIERGTQGVHWGCSADDVSRGLGARRAFRRGSLAGPRYDAPLIKGSLGRSGTALRDSSLVSPSVQGTAAPTR
jgi:hypothetical protein